MATRQLNIYADIDSGRLITSASSTLQATLPRFTYRDTIPVSFRALTASGSPSAPWRDADLTGQSVRIAIGNPSARPLSGSFAMTYDGDTTTAIQWDASATDVASAINILDSVISAGGVSVSKQTNGIYRIAFLTVGAKEDFLTDSGPLVPSGSMITNRVVTGDATTKEIVALSFEALPAAYADLSDPLPSAAATITTVRVGSGSAGEIRTIEFPVIPFGGTYSLAVNGNSTTGLAWDASAEDVAYALQYLAGMAGNVTVTGAFPFFTVNFATSVGELTSMTADPSGLVVPVGRMGTLSTATSEFLDMLAGSSLASAKFEIELHDIATDDTWTIIQADCQVARDIISENPVVPALRPTPRDWLETQLDDLGIPVPVLVNAIAANPPAIREAAGLGPNDTIEAFLEFGDTSGQILIPGTSGNKVISLKSGMLCMDDGTASKVVGGLHGALSHLMDTSGDKEFVPLETLSIKAGAWNSGDVLRINGTIRAKFNNIANRTAASLQLRMDQAPASKGIVFDLTAATMDAAEWHLFGDFTLTLFDPDLYLGFDEGISCIAYPSAAASYVLNPADDFTVTGPAGDDLDVLIGIFIDTSDANLSGTLSAGWDINFQIVTP